MRQFGGGKRNLGAGRGTDAAAITFPSALCHALGAGAGHCRGGGSGTGVCWLWVPGDSQDPSWGHGRGAAAASDVLWSAWQMGKGFPRAASSGDFPSHPKADAFQKQTKPRPSTPSPGSGPFPGAPWPRTWQEPREAPCPLGEMCSSRHCGGYGDAPCAKAEPVGTWTWPSHPAGGCSPNADARLPWCQHFGGSGLSRSGLGAP